MNRRPDNYSTAPRPGHRDPRDPRDPAAYPQSRQQYPTDPRQQGYDPRSNGYPAERPQQYNGYHNAPQYPPSHHREPSNDYPYRNYPTQPRKPDPAR